MQMGAMGVFMVVQFEDLGHIWVLIYMCLFAQTYECQGYVHQNWCPNRYIKASYPSSLRPHTLPAQGVINT